MSVAVALDEKLISDFLEPGTKEHVLAEMELKRIFESLNGDDKQVDVEVIGGVEGACLAIVSQGTEIGTRIAGPKPWGGGIVQYHWTVNVSKLLDALVERQKP